MRGAMAASSRASTAHAGPVQACGIASRSKIAKGAAPAVEAISNSADRSAARNRSSADQSAHSAAAQLTAAPIAVESGGGGVGNKKEEDTAEHPPPKALLL